MTLSSAATWVTVGLAVLTLCPALHAEPASSQVPLTFSGGHDTLPEDHGRPVILVAAGLNVPPEVFRRAFRDVRPAPPGEQPGPDRTRRNKQVLMAALGPYGVTNDRLDTVSNYYRYNRQEQDLWRNRPAAGFATVRDGVVTGVTISDAGAGYSSPPTISVPGMPAVGITATLHFGTDLDKNGSIQNAKLSAGAAQP